MSNSQDVTLFVRTLDDHSVLILTETSISVFQLKERIQVRTGIPVHHQRLLHQGRRLKDDLLLIDYQLNIGDHLYLVAKVDEELDPLLQITESLILNNLTSTRRRREVQTPSFQQLLQTLTQHSFTIDSLLSQSPPDYYIGQWVDVKDTVDQWLEAQILDTSTSSVYIHYNGWATQWNEWIQKNSPRIKPFRSMTHQPLGTVSKSPAPATDALLQVENLQELGAVTKTVHYLEQLVGLASVSDSTEDQKTLAQTNVAAVDRVGRFMIDMAHLLAACKPET